MVEPVEEPERTVGAVVRGLEQRGVAIAGLYPLDREAPAFSEVPQGEVVRCGFGCDHTEVDDSRQLPVVHQDVNG
jgi:hypothetical protein